MALKQLISRHTISCHSPIFLCCRKPEKMVHQKVNISRRMVGMTAAVSVLVVKDVILRPEIAFGLDFSLVAPGPTLEMAENGIKDHADSLLSIKPYLESESWSQAQKLMRKSASNLKIDFYTIIQNKPGSERPLLRKLYFDLFNNVTKLDYAARDKDASRVWECYGNIVAALDDFMGRI